MSKHQPIIKTTIKSIWPVAFARVSARKSFYKLLSNHLCRSIFLVMFYAFSIFFWTALDRCVWIMKIILWEPSYFRHSNNIQIVVSNCKSLIAKTFDGNVLILIAASPSYVIKNKKQCFQLFLDWPPALFLRTLFLARWIEFFQACRAFLGGVESWDLSLIE